MNHDWVGLSDPVQHASSPGTLHEQACALSKASPKLITSGPDSSQPGLHLLEPS